MRDTVRTAFQRLDEPEEGIEVIDVELGENVIDTQPRMGCVPFTASRSQQREVCDDAFEIRADSDGFEDFFRAAVDRNDQAREFGVEDHRDRLLGHQRAVRNHIAEGDAIRS